MKEKLIELLDLKPAQGATEVSEEQNLIAAVAANQSQLYGHHRAAEYEKAIKDVMHGILHTGRSIVKGQAGLGSTRRDRRQGAQENETQLRAHFIFPPCGLPVSFLLVFCTGGFAWPQKAAPSASSWRGAAEVFNLIKLPWDQSCNILPPRIKSVPGCASDDEGPGSLKHSVARPARQHDPAGSQAPISEPRPQVVAARRRRELLEYQRLQKVHGQARAARMVGTTVTTLWRWQNRFTAKGLAGLMPANFKSGRRSKFKPIRLTAPALRELESLLVENSSPRDAWQKFRFSPSCPSMVARFVQRHGRAPAALAGIVRLQRVQARVMASADGRRIYVKIPANGILYSRLALPAGFKLKVVRA